MNRPELLDCLGTRYNIEELKTKCFEVGINYEDFDTAGQPSFIRELILFCERNDRLDWLQRLCDEKGGSMPKLPPNISLRDYDYAIVAECHATLFSLRNVFEEKLPVQEFRERQITQVEELSLKILQNSATLKRLMGEDWVRKLIETVSKAVILNRKLAGAIRLKGIEDIKNWPEDRVKALFTDYNDKRILIEQIDSQISDLETRLK